MELGIALQVLVGESRIPQDREGVHRAELSKREHLSTWNPGFPLTWAALAVVSLVPTVVGSRCTHRVPAWRNTTRCVLSTFCLPKERGKPGHLSGFSGLFGFRCGALSWNLITGGEEK